MLLNGGPIKLRVSLRRQNDSIDVRGRHSAPLKCKMLLLDWIGSKLNLIIAGQQLGELDRLIYPGGGRASDKICSPIQKLPLKTADVGDFGVRLISGCRLEVGCTQQQ